MNRKETTAKLSKILEFDKLSGAGKYYSKEVTFDFGTSHPIRLDYLQYVPDGAVYASEIENGYFICYEIKSCKEDIYSGNGLNFIAEKNYIVTTMECYKSILPDIQSGKLSDYINEANKREPWWDILVAIPDYKIEDKGYKNGWRQSTPLDEFDNPTPLERDCQWKLSAMQIGNIRKQYRLRSKVEMLFCMLRAGKG